VNSLPLATIYEVKIPLRKWKKSLLQRNPAQMTLAIDGQKKFQKKFHSKFLEFFRIFFTTFMTPIMHSEK
jgi:hypothetical protein